MKKKQVVSHYNYKMALIKTSVLTYANSLSTPSHHPCHFLFLSRDHLRSWDHLQTRTVQANLMLWSNPAIDWHPIKGEGEIFSETGDKRRPDGPLCLHANLLPFLPNHKICLLLGTLHSGRNLDLGHSVEVLGQHHQPEMNVKSY